MSIAFFINSILLGVGLAMDAFSVSIVNGIAEPKMKAGKTTLIAGTFAFFQALNPMLGYIAVHTIVQHFTSLEGCLPVMAFILLAYIGGRMLYGAIKCMRCKKGATVRPCKEKTCLSDGNAQLSLKVLLVQGIATSIDALSVGFTIADYDLIMALVCALIIAAVTFIICMGGLKFGNRIGTILAEKAQLVGGIILIAIGLEILLSSLI